MLLAIDVGNTNTVFALHDGRELLYSESNAVKERIHDRERIRTLDELLDDGDVRLRRTRLAAHVLRDERLLGVVRNVTTQQ